MPISMVVLAAFVARDAAKSPEEAAFDKVMAELPALLKAADADGNGALTGTKVKRAN